MQLTIIAMAVAALLAFGSAWKVQDWRFDAREKERLELAQEAQKMRQKATVQASVKYEKKKEETRVKYVTVVETIEKIVERPIYKNTCIDEDGLKVINEGITP